MVSTKIPDKYKYKVDANGNISRVVSDYGCEIHNLLDMDSHDEEAICKNLSLIKCPKCGKKMLLVADGFDHTIAKYFYVYCSGCDWQTPSSLICEDKFSAIDVFVEWLEVFHYINEDEAYINTDIAKYLMTPEAKEMQDYIESLPTIGELENAKENTEAGKTPVASIPLSTIYQLVKLAKPVSELYFSSHTHSSYEFDVDKTFAPLEGVLSDAITGYRCPECKQNLFYTNEQKTHLICLDCNKTFERNEIS